MKRVHIATEAADDQDNGPMVVDVRPQVPSRIRHVIEKAGPDPGPVLAQMASRLEKAGAEALAMLCNTANLSATQIEEALGIAQPNRPELACAKAAESMERD